MWVAGSVAAIIVVSFVIYRFFIEKPLIIESEVGREDNAKPPVLDPPDVLTPSKSDESARMPVADFTLPNYKTGQSKSIYQLLKEGKKVFIVVWSSSCSYCRAEFPKIKELQTKLATSSDKALLLITADKTLSGPTETMKKAGLWDGGSNTFHLSDPDSAVVRDVLKVPGYPFHALITEQKKQLEISINDLIAAA